MRPLKLSFSADDLGLHGGDFGLLLSVRARGRHRLEEAHRVVMGGTEGAHQIVGGAGGKFLGAHPHGGQRQLEFAARLGDLGGLMRAVEGVLDLRLRRS